MKDYYNEYVKYATRLILNNDDYGNKSKVRAHNRAMRKLLLLKKEMQDIECAEILYKLLKHDDERVKMHAADVCLSMNIYVDSAFHILKELSITSSEAPMLLGKHLRRIQSNGTCDY